MGHPNTKWSRRFQSRDIDKNDACCQTIDVWFDLLSGGGLTSVQLLNERSFSLDSSICYFCLPMISLTLNVYRSLKSIWKQPIMHHLQRTESQQDFLTRFLIMSYKRPLKLRDGCDIVDLAFRNFSINKSLKFKKGFINCRTGKSMHWAQSFLVLGLIFCDKSISLPMQLICFEKGGFNGFQRTW